VLQKGEMGSFFVSRYFHYCSLKIYSFLYTVFFPVIVFASRISITKIDWTPGEKVKSHEIANLPCIILFEGCCYVYLKVYIVQTLQRL